MKDCADTAHREKRLDPFASGFLKCHEAARRQRAYIDGTFVQQRYVLATKIRSDNDTF
jgi:hypothetical protein